MAKLVKTIELTKEEIATVKNATEILSEIYRQIGNKEDLAEYKNSEIIEDLLATAELF